MGDITVLLARARDNDRAASDALFELLYDDLRRLARSRLAHSGHQTLLNTSALVHEAYLRFQQAGRISLHDREHFLAYAATTLRSVVVDFVRKRSAERRGGYAVHVTLDTGVADELSRSCPTRSNRACSTFSTRSCSSRRTTGVESQPGRPPHRGLSAIRTRQHPAARALQRSDRSGVKRAAVVRASALSSDGAMRARLADARGAPAYDRMWQSPNHDRRRRVT